MLLASVQRRYGPDQVPKLTVWFAGLMQAIIERYHSRKTRDKVQQSVEAIAKKGDLFALQQLVDDPEMIERDRNGFRQAQSTYAKLAEEVASVTLFALDKAQLEATVGRETAAVVSSAVALLLAGGIILATLAG